MPIDKEMTPAVKNELLANHLVTFNEDDMSTFLSRFFTQGIGYSLVLYSAVLLEITWK